MKSIRDVDVREKKVFLRVDFNVPMHDGKITNINRIKSAAPTVQFLVEKRAKVILGTHLGRPEGKFNSEFSTIPVAKELAKILNKEVYATDQVIGSTVQAKIDELKPSEILMLGNLRFDPREETNDQTFAKELASLADIYVNDAFAVSHRANASVEAITNFIPSYSGLLLESEITTLGFLLRNPEKPFVLIIGGAKVEDKAGLLKNLLEKADKVLVGGAVANTFLSAKGEKTSQSLIDTEMIPLCQELLQKYNDKIVLPEDTVKKELPGGEFNILDIGLRTRENFAREIIQAKCVFWNGNMGYTEDPAYTEGTKSVAEAMVANHNTTVIAGGDTVGFIDENNLSSGISFISTGGGAAMEFLAGETLPGIKALERNE